MRACPAATASRGYTLLDLLLATTVAGLLLQASFGLGALIGRERQTLSVLELQRLVQFTRGQAVNLQQEVTLCALDTRRACDRRWDGRDIAVFADRDRDRRLDPGEALFLDHWPTDRGRLAWRASLGRDFLTFSAMGSTHQNGSFVLCFDRQDERADVVLTLNRGGRPYLNKTRGRSCPR